MLIEVRRKAGQVEGALVFGKAPSSLVPRTKFFGNEGPVSLIHLVSQIGFLGSRKTKWRLWICFHKLSEF